MKNISMDVDKDGILTIRVDTKQDHGPSHTGKSTIVATTQGNAPVKVKDGEVLVEVNVFRQ